MSDSVRLGRRAFLSHGTLLLSAAVLDPLGSSRCWAAKADETQLTVGLVTDLHYADKAPAGSRHYRQTPEKLAEAAERFAAEGIDLLIELGDFVDAADSVETELGYLKHIDRQFAAIAKDRHYVLGNHCVDTLTKDEFLGTVGQARSYYSFDRGPFHFVVLDSCFRGDGQPYGRKNSTWTDANLPRQELDWLEADLAKTTRKTIVLAHQRLDVGSPYGVKNAPAVRKLLEDSGKVAAVFQGHSHKNDYRDLGGIHYCTLVAMVEGSSADSNGYSTMQLDAQGNIKITGFRQQKQYRW